MNLGGILVPLTTPFSPDGENINYAALRSNAARLLEDGAVGFLAAGSTGEAPLLTEEEFRAVVREIRTVVPAERPLLAGAGRESTAATVSACRSACEAGADAALVRSPAYFHPAMTEAALLEHFTRVADESPIPVLLYNMPKYTHVSFPPSLLASLSEHRNIIGAKDSSGNLDNFKEYRDAAPGWAMLVGSGATLLGGLQLGAVGGIVAVGNFACSLAATLYRQFEDGDAAPAATGQERLGSMHHGIVARYGPAGVKVAMDCSDLFGGIPRAPLPHLTPGAVDEVAKVLADNR